MDCSYSFTKEAMKNIMEAYPEITMTIAGGGTGVGIKQK